MITLRVRRVYTPRREFSADTPADGEPRRDLWVVSPTSRRDQKQTRAAERHPSEYACTKRVFDTSRRVVRTSGARARVSS